MGFGGDDWVLKLMGTEERASCSGLTFWKILMNRSTHGSIPITATPDGRNIWILGDGVESTSSPNTECLELDGSYLSSQHIADLCYIVQIIKFKPIFRVYILRIRLEEIIYKCYVANLFLLSQNLTISANSLIRPILLDS